MDLKGKHGTLLKNFLLKHLSLAEESHISVTCVCNQLMRSAMIVSYFLHVTLQRFTLWKQKFLDFMHHSRNKSFPEREEIKGSPIAETS